VSSEEDEDELSQGDVEDDNKKPKKGNGGNEPGVAKRL